MTRPRPPPPEQKDRHDWKHSLAYVVSNKRKSQSVLVMKWLHTWVACKQELFLSVPVEEPKKIAYLDETTIIHANVGRLFMRPLHWYHEPHSLSDFTETMEHANCSIWGLFCLPINRPPSQNRNYVTSYCRIFGIGSHFAHLINTNVQLDLWY